VTPRTNGVLRRREPTMRAHRYRNGVTSQLSRCLGGRQSTGQPGIAHDVGSSVIRRPEPPHSARAHAVHAQTVACARLRLKSIDRAWGPGYNPAFRSGTEPSGRPRRKTGVRVRGAVVHLAEVPEVSSGSGFGQDWRR
jgi:hypothetical protein